jgi:cell division protein FtsI/penicillin-binding protein 2
VIEDRYVPRGSLLDRSNVVINTNDGKAGSYTRVYKYPDLAPIVGYNHPVYGQAGLEAVLDEYLRGEKGNPAATILWNHLVYGMSPSGLDVRLSIDLYLQYRADDMMITEKGAVILLNAQSGEILVMSSRPTFNPNYMNEIGPRLNKDPDKPLINRATLGLYPTGSLVNPFAQSIFGKKNLDENELNDVYEAFGFFRTPEIQIQVAKPLTSSELKNPHVTPLQVALASAALSNHGMIPAPRIATAVDTPSEGWVVLPALGTPFEALQSLAADDAAKSLMVEGQTYWAYIGKAHENDSTVTWFIAGTPPNWQASPLVVVVLLEGDDERIARRVGQELLIDAMNP